MGVVEHARLGFNYRLDEVAAALGVAQLERLDAAARRARPGRCRLRRAPRQRSRAWCCRCADRGPERRGWFVYVVGLPEGADRDAVIATLGERGIESKAYLPCIHLLPFYRERFGFRGGEFPVAEALRGALGRAAVLSRDVASSRWTGSVRRCRPRSRRTVLTSVVEGCE